ncbi:MAG: hypothetical protein HQK83_18730 [Fibrobacteria bacterium]|nr:hypothetical protein [Fibrobacteria bacterium]
MKIRTFLICLIPLLLALAQVPAPLKQPETQPSEKVSSKAPVNLNVLSFDKTQKSLKDKTRRIIFLNYSIRKNSEGGIEIQLINQKLTCGKIKKRRSKTKRKGAKGMKEVKGMECIQIDKDFRQLASKQVPNPLSRVLEYVDDTGKFAKKTVELDSTEFTVRMQLDPDTESIGVQYANSGSKNNDSLYLIITRVEFP